jgi:hypothetical protein
MKKRYERYIEYIVNDIDLPYFKNMEEQYGLSEKEYKLVLSKVFNQSVTIKGNLVYNTDGNKIYLEYSNGNWEKSEYDNQGNRIYVENSNGYWYKYEYDTNGNRIHYENSDGYIEDYR